MMRSDMVIAHFQGVPATAKALGVSDQAVRLWGELVPPEMAMIAYCVANGALFLDPYLYLDWPRPGRVLDKANDRRFKSTKRRKGK